MASTAPRPAYAPLGPLPTNDVLATTLSRLTLAQLKPLLQLLNATAGAGRKADIIEKISATLAQRVASYNEALRHSQTNVVDLYWRQLREVVHSVNSAGKGIRLVLYFANGLPALPSSGAAAAVQSSAMPTASAPSPSVAPSTSSYAYARTAAVAPPSLRVTHDPEGGGLKRKRDDEPASAAVLPPIKRPHIAAAPSTIPASTTYHVTMPMSQNSTMVRTVPSSRAGAIPGTNVNIEEIDDPFFRLAPYPPLASFSLEASSPIASAGPRSRAFQINIPEPTWNQMQGATPQYRAILRCFMVTSVKPGMPAPEPAKHSWPVGTYIFINQNYVDITKLRKDEKKKTLEMPLDMSPWLKASMNQITIQASSMMNYHVVVQLMKPVSVNELVENVRKNCAISYEAGRTHVLNSFRGNGDDLMEMKKKVALSDPLVLTRIKVPARPSTCRHIGCFDLTNFLLMNERIRTWRCPVCNSDAPYKTLIVDGWMNHILNALGPDDSEFVVYPDANWTDEKGRQHGSSGSSTPAPAASAMVSPQPTRPVGSTSITPASARPKPVAIIAIDDSDDEDYADIGGNNVSQGANSSDDYLPAPPAAATTNSSLNSSGHHQLSGSGSIANDNPDWRRATQAFPAASPVYNNGSSLTVAPQQQTQGSFQWMQPNTNHASASMVEEIIDLTDD